MGAIAGVWQRMGGWVADDPAGARGTQGLNRGIRGGGSTWVVGGDGGIGPPALIPALGRGVFWRARAVAVIAALSKPVVDVPGFGGPSVGRKGAPNQSALVSTLLGG